jgi:uncharacterized membrane protein
MTKPSSNRAVMVVLAYLWPLAIVPLLVERDDADVQWHARHGLVLMGAELLILVAVWILVALASLLSVALGCALGVMVVLLWIAIPAVHVAAILKALSGARLVVPGVTEYADRSRARP